MRKFAFAAPKHWHTILYNKILALKYKLIISSIVLCALIPGLALAIDGPSDAQLPTKSSEARTQSDWSELALREIRAGSTLAGLRHARKAMQLHSLKDAAAPRTALGFLGDQIIITLTPNHPADAEKLLLEAVERTKTVTGDKSVSTQAQRGDLFAFCVQQKDYHAALKTLDQALDFDLSTGVTPSQALRINQNVRSPVRPHTSVGVIHLALEEIKKVDSANFAFSRIAIEKILKAELAYLAVDDERLVEPLAALADVYFEAKKFKQAEVYFGRAYKTSEKYHPERAFAVRSVARIFLAICGRTDSLQRRF